MNNLKLTDIYVAILKYIGLATDQDGYISTALNEKREPVLIDGVRLVMPYDRHLKNFDPRDKMIFHPLAENILRGESKVFIKIKQMLNIKLNYTIGVIGQSLLNLLASPELHHKLTPEQSELLISVKEADEKSVTSFISVMVSGVKNKPDKLFANIYILAGGKYKERKYSKVGIIRFPFYEDLLEGKVEKIRVKDKETYKQLFKFMFPNVEEKDSYNAGSDSRVAPYMEALLMSSINVTIQINTLINMYKEFIDDADNLLFDPEWMDYFTTLEMLGPEIRKIPHQSGNSGSLSVFNSEEEIEATQSTPVVQPVIKPGTWQSPQQVYQQQPIASQPLKPEIKKTDGKLDFAAMSRSSPQMSFNPGMTMMTPQQMQMQQMQQTPSWARPNMPQQFQQQQQFQQPFQQPLGNMNNQNLI